MIKERKTDQKMVLIKYLNKNANKHLSVQQIHEDLKENVSITTIYRMLNSLIQRGIVSKIPLENRQGFCYQYSLKEEKCKEHYHLICKKCDKLLHFESNEFNNVCNEAKINANFEIDKGRVVFYGICEDCKLGENNEK